MMAVTRRWTGDMIVKNAIIKSERRTFEATPSKMHEPYLPHFDISITKTEYCSRFTRKLRKM